MIRPPISRIFIDVFCRDWDIVKHHGPIDQIQQARETFEKLLTRLRTAPVGRDRFVSHLYQSRREYRRACETAGKSGKQIERSAISTFRIAWSVGFKGEFRQREHLLALPLRSNLTADL